MMGRHLVSQFITDEFRYSVQQVLDDALQTGLHDALAPHYLPPPNPSLINDVAGVRLGDTLKRSEIEPPLELVEHGLVALLVLQGLVVPCG